MNDIERIEKLITTKFNNDYSIDSEDKKAIENLIARVKYYEKTILDKQVNNEYKKMWEEITGLARKLEGENKQLKERLKKVKKYIESEMDIVDNPTICGDEEDTIIELPISLCLYNEDLRKLLELLEGE